MSSSAPSPPVTHPVSHHEQQRTSSSSSPAYYYPRHHPTRPPPSLQRPPVAYAGHHRYNPALRVQPENANVKLSVSSAASGSSTTSELKPHQPIDPYIMGSHAERGMVRDTSRRSSHMSPNRTHPPERNHIANREMVEDHSAVIRYLQEHEIEDDEPVEKDHAIWILFWLSFLDPFHSFFSCFFSIFVLLGLVITAPLRLFQKEASFSTTLIRTVAPVFRNHLQMLCAPSVKHAHTFDFKPGMLIFVHALSPILSLGVAFFSWISAVFWLFAIVMGNPDGTEKRDDGRATVIMVRNWWEKYFLSALNRR